MSTREIFNRIYAEWKGTPYDKTKNQAPLDFETHRAACRIIRQTLYGARSEDPRATFSEFALKKGVETWNNIPISHALDLANLKKTLERRFNVLGMAVNYWAAEWLIMEVLRRDKVRKHSSAIRSHQISSQSGTASGVRDDLHPERNTVQGSPDATMNDSGGEDESGDELAPVAPGGDLRRNVKRKRLSPVFSSEEDEDEEYLRALRVIEKRKRCKREARKRLELKFEDSA